MYTVLIQPDNTLITTVKTNIMHRSSMVDGFHVLVDEIYNGSEKFDMKTFQCAMEYKLPISDAYTAEILTPSEELYGNKLEYTLPIDTEITSEVGEVEFKFIFTRLDMLSDGSMVERVRKTSSTTLRVLPVALWNDYIADARLDSLSQIMLMNQSKAEYLEGIADKLVSAADSLNKNKLDNVVYNAETNTVHGVVNGKVVDGGAVLTEDLCDCEEGVPVVEFNASDPVAPDEVDNVVEF